MAGRTLQKHFRVYADGYDLSGFGRSIGPFGVTYDEVDLTVWTDQVKGYLPSHQQADLGTLNAVFDNTLTTGLHTAMKTSGVKRIVTVALGDRAAPVAGVPIFAGEFAQAGYQATDDGGAVSVTIPFEGFAADAGTLLYGGGFGVLLHENKAETDVNAAAGFSSLTDAATTHGGFMVYHVLAGNGNATISIDDSANNSDWLALSGATTGNIDLSNPTYGVVNLGNTATVRRYLRWQLALDTATSVTFVLGFVRG